MEKEALKLAYENIIDGKLSSHIAVHTATGIHVESLKKFKTTGSLGEDKRQILHDWMERHEYLPTESKGDVLREVRRKLVGCLDTLDNPIHGRDRKARIVLNELEVLHREYGPELHKMGKLPTDQHIR